MPTGETTELTRADVGPAPTDTGNRNTEESIEMRILRYNIEAVKMVEKAMGINREGTK